MTRGTPCHAHRFPFMGHRTLRDVAETDRLLGRKFMGTLTPQTEERLSWLLLKARLYNPPFERTPGDAA